MGQIGKQPWKQYSNQQFRGYQLTKQLPGRSAPAGNEVEHLQGEGLAPAGSEVQHPRGKGLVPPGGEVEHPPPKFRNIPVQRFRTFEGR